MEKQLTAMYDSVEPLKDTSFHKLQQQLERASFVYGWPDYILNVDDDNLTWMTTLTPKHFITSRTRT